MPGTRPLDIVNADIAATRLAIVVANELIAKALELRRMLLEAGWPSEHGLCVKFDRVATDWTGEVRGQQAALARLLEELD